MSFLKTNQNTAQELGWQMLTAAEILSERPLQMMLHVRCWTTGKCYSTVRKKKKNLDNFHFLLLFFFHCCSIISNFTLPCSRSEAGYWFCKHLMHSQPSFSRWAEFLCIHHYIQKQISVELSKLFFFSRSPFFSQRETHLVHLIASHDPALTFTSTNTQKNLFGQSRFPVRDQVLYFRLSLH